MRSKRTDQLKVTDAGLHPELAPELIDYELSEADEVHNMLGAMIDVLQTGDFDFYASFVVDGKQKHARWSKKDVSMSPEHLFSLIILNDYKFLVMKGGREGRDEQAVANDLSEPFFSFTASYLFGDKRIQNPYFQKLFETLRPRFKDYVERTNRVHNNSRFMLEEVLRVYNEHHPDTKVSTS